MRVTRGDQRPDTRNPREVSSALPASKIEKVYLIDWEWIDDERSEIIEKRVSHQNLIRLTKRNNNGSYYYTPDFVTVGYLSDHAEIADYLQDLEDCSEEDLNDIEVAILPPDEVDEVTDIEEGPDDDMGVIPVSDVAGQVEFSCTIDQTIYKRFQTKSLLFLDEKSEGSTCKPTPGSSKVLLEPVRFDNIGHYMTKRANRGDGKDKAVKNL
ncbi:hypothetical protein EVAR_95027_1 [Eumeta japonica]|uniref:Uncharacterized protein n=1 Tax=Eumeta variegata TaxID=151549 RepID=A0A4C1VSD8_EUMVA|nr:hypothetical protein EVAR_95027_1 [Eumeta japonica]